MDRAGASVGSRFHAEEIDASGGEGRGRMTRDPAGELVEGYAMGSLSTTGYTGRRCDARDELEANRVLALGTGL